MLELYKSAQFSVLDSNDCQVSAMLTAIARINDLSKRSDGIDDLRARAICSKPSDRLDLSGSI